MSSSKSTTEYKTQERDEGKGRVRRCGDTDRGHTSGESMTSDPRSTHCSTSTSRWRQPIRRFPPSLLPASYWYDVTRSSNICFSLVYRTSDAPFRDISTYAHDHGSTVAYHRLSFKCSRATLPTAIGYHFSTSRRMFRIRNNRPFTYPKCSREIPQAPYRSARHRLHEHLSVVLLLQNTLASSAQLPRSPQDSKFKFGRPDEGGWCRRRREDSRFIKAHTVRLSVRVSIPPLVY
jgi:hypothetical protein